MDEYEVYEEENEHIEIENGELGLFKELKVYSYCSSTRQSA